MISKAIFYKEWLKTRRVLLVLLLVAVLLVIYTFIHTNYFFRTNGAMQAWDLVIQKDASILPAFLKWYFPLAALALSIVQYSNEIVDKRFKLTLHLPLPENTILSSMLGFGVIAITAAYALLYLPTAGGLLLYYPREIIAATSLQLLPYALAGYACYFLAAWSIIEPIWKRKVIHAFLSLAIVSTFVIEAKSGGYIYGIPFLLLAIAVAVSCLFLSASRFKDGAQK